MVLPYGSEYNKQTNILNKPIYKNTYTKNKKYGQNYKETSFSILLSTTADSNINKTKNKQTKKKPYLQKHLYKRWKYRQIIKKHLSVCSWK